MNSYFKLVNFEIRRFFKLYAVLACLAVILQLVGTAVISKMYVQDAEKQMQLQNLKIDEYAKIIETNGPQKIDFTYVLTSLWTLAPIAICICALLFYVFFIWYRDWFASNAFIYRLLMLPAERMNLYFSKASAVLLMIFGLVAIETLLFPLEFQLFLSIIPEPIRNTYPLMDSIQSVRVLGILFPQSFSEFLFFYGMGMMAVFAVFTAILLERSFKWIGIVIGIFYCGGTLCILLSPILMANTVLNKLYPSELVLTELVVILVSFAASILISRFLLNKKVTV